MQTSRNLTRMIVVFFSLLILTTAALAADPGLPFPASSQVSDQKPGSVLFFNLYNSGATSGVSQNTRINITNTNVNTRAFVHLFFVADSCSIADSFVCLTPNQTVSFMASDIDPGVKGYIVAVAVDASGCPLGFNWLIGDEFIKLSSGHIGSLMAESFAALFTGALPGCDDTTSLAAMRFDGVNYNQAPRALALSHIPSRADGNDTMIIINRFGGNLGTGASTISALFGILYDDAENALSFSITGSCQLMNSLSNSFPRTAPRFETFIPSGRTGWMRLYSQSDIGIVGAMFNLNNNLTTQTSAYTGGHNLHKLTLSTINTYTIPVFPPSC